MNHDLDHFFGPAARHRLSVTEKEQAYRDLLKRRQMIAPMSSYSGSFLWRTLSTLFFSWTPAAATVLVLVFTGAGMTFAGQAMPGDYLYPLKRIREQVRSTVQWDTASKADVEMDHLDARLAEAETLEAKGELTAKTAASLDQDFAKTHKEAIENAKVLTFDEKRQEQADRILTRLEKYEDRYERTLKKHNRQEQKLQQKQEGTADARLMNAKQMPVTGSAALSISADAAVEVAVPSAAIMMDNAPEETAKSLRKKLREMQKLRKENREKNDDDGRNTAEDDVGDVER